MEIWCLSFQLLHMSLKYCLRIRCVLPFFKCNGKPFSYFSLLKYLWGEPLANAVNAIIIIGIFFASAHMLTESIERDFHEYKYIENDTKKLHATLNFKLNGNFILFASTQIWLFQSTFFYLLISNKNNG